MSDLASVVIALGYHGSTTQEDSQVPLYLQQLRKRALAGAYELDKGLAIFVGRPPHLSRHYIGLGLPLDLPATAIMSTPAVSYWPNWQQHGRRSHLTSNTNLLRGPGTRPTTP